MARRFATRIGAIRANRSSSAKWWFSLLMIWGFGGPGVQTSWQSSVRPKTLLGCRLKWYKKGVARAHRAPVGRKAILGPSKSVTGRCLDRFADKNNFHHVQAIRANRVGPSCDSQLFVRRNAIRKKKRGSVREPSSDSCESPDSRESATLWIFLGYF